VAVPDVTLISHTAISA